MGTKAYDNALDLITFSRASGGTALRKISYGSELVTNGTFDTDTGWSKGTGWTISGGTANKTTADNTSIYAEIATQVGVAYKVSFDVAVGSVSSGVKPIVDGVTYTLRKDVGTYTFVFVASGSSTIVYFNGGSFSGGSIDNISIKEVLFDQPDGTLTLFNHPTNIPRIDYNADGTVKGLLIEEQRVNLFTYGNDFTSETAAWSATGIASRFSGAESIDGGVNATTLVEDSSTGVHELSELIAALPAGTYTQSVFAKSGSRTKLRMQNTNAFSSNNYADFDLSAGTFSIGSSADSAAIVDMGGGWYRCSVTSTSGGVAAGILKLTILDAGGSASYTGDGTSSILIYGAQLEAGSFPTSYIPTSGATATRAADIASIPVTDFGYNQKEGSVVVEFNSISPLEARTNDGVVSLEVDNDDLQRVYLPAANTLSYQMKVDGSSIFADTLLAEVVQGTQYKASIAFASGSQTGNVNGGSVTTFGTGTSLPAAATTLKLGLINTSDYLNGHIKSIQYYPRKLSDTQLQELTA